MCLGVSVLVAGAVGSASGDRVFALPVLYQTGPNPDFLAIQDLNGDGWPDLVVANYNSGGVSVLLGSGNGAFGSRIDYETGSTPTSVALGDVDGDGVLDLAVANMGSNTVSVFLGDSDIAGNPNGNFVLRTDYVTGDAPTSVTTVDLNGDGRLDLAVTNSGSNSVGVFLGTGGGGFAPRVDYATGSRPLFVTTGLLNGDSAPDLAVANSQSNTISVLLGQGNGRFDTKMDFDSGNGPNSIALGDVNHDGHADLLVTNFTSGNVSVFLGDGTGMYPARTDYTAGQGPSSVAIGDLDDDGRLDYVVASLYSYFLSVTHGNGDGTFGMSTYHPAGGTPAWVAIGDVNVDGIPDLAVANGPEYVSILLGTDNFPPVLVAPATASGAEGVPLMITASVTDPDVGNTLTITASGFPQDLSFASVADSTSRTATISGTPGFFDAGTYSILWSVNDGTGLPNGGNGAYTFLTIANTNVGPELVQPLDMTVREGASQGQTMSATDPDGSIVTFAKVAGPGFMRVTATGATTGRIALAPGFADAAGSPYAASVRATDSSGLSEDKSFHIVVVNVDRPPMLAEIWNVTLEAGRVADVPITASDPDSDGIALSASLPSFATMTTSPQIGTTQAGSIRIAPPPDVSGSFPASVTATANAVVATKSINITVKSPNRAPTLAQPVDMTVDEGTTANQLLTAVDPDGNALPFSKVAGPSFLTVTTVMVGTGTGTGNIHLAPSFLDAGTYTATVRTSDGSSNSDRTLTITVGNVNRAPTIQGIVDMTVDEGAVADQRIEGSDPDQDPLSFSLEAGPGFVTVTNTSTNAGAPGMGTIRVEPGFADAGVYPVTVRVSDGYLEGDQLITITVLDVPVLPARLFTQESFTKVNLASGRGYWCVQIEPLNRGDFESRDVDPTSIVMRVGNNQIASDAASTISGGDSNLDGVPEITACFKIQDLRAMLGSLPPGETPVTAILEGNLHARRRFTGEARFAVQSPSPHPHLSASVSPNPLNPLGTLTFFMPKPGRVWVRFYEFNGKLVRTLREGSLEPAGYHDVSIDGRNRNGERLASGIYFYRIEAPDGTVTGRFAIAK